MAKKKGECIYFEETVTFFFCFGRCQQEARKEIPQGPPPCASTLLRPCDTG